MPAIRRFRLLVRLTALERRMTRMSFRRAHLDYASVSPFVLLITAALLPVPRLP